MSQDLIGYNFWQRIDADRPLFVAEIGKNFIQTEADQPTEVYLANACDLVDAAISVGADAVKFQTHRVLDEQLPAAYTSPHWPGVDRYAWVKRNSDATPVDGFWRPLRDYCRAKGIMFFSTPMSRGAAILLSGIDMGVWKVSSADLLDFVLLDYLAATHRPLILSTGMSTLDEIDLTVSFLRRRAVRFMLLHCVSKYPTSRDEVHPEVIGLLAKRYGVPVGLSDHSLEIDSAVAGVAFGARLIERHFSLSRGLWGPDHHISTTPEEFRALVEAARQVAGERSYDQAGSVAKVVLPEEQELRLYFRKGLVANRRMGKGSTLEEVDIWAIRPQGRIDGLPSQAYEDVVGRRITRALGPYEPIRPDMLE